jgi:hypothetical protein
MAFSFAGAASGAAGAIRQQHEDARQQQADELTQLLAQRKYEMDLQQMEMQKQAGARAEQGLGMERERLGMDRQRAEAQQKESAAKTSRDNNNTGIYQMVGSLIQREGITPQNRHKIIGTLAEAGQMPTSAQLMDDPEADLQREIQKARSVGDINRANDLAVLGARGAQEAGLIRQRGEQDRLTDAAKPATSAASRPPTEGERKAGGFYTQMDQALQNINELEKTLSERDIYQIVSLPQEGITGALNRGAMSENAKRYIQAFNQFTEARLRPVSGAAIADSEYARDRATYGKQHSETETLAQQRLAARQRALDSLRIMAGNAAPQAGAGDQSAGQVEEWARDPKTGKLVRTR